MRLISNKIYLTIALITLVVLATAFVLGLMSSNKMREVISEQFNQQQLIIAKSVASDIEEKFAFIKNELHTLNLSPAIQYLEVSWPNRMQITLENVKTLWRGGNRSGGRLRARRQKSTGWTARENSESPGSILPSCRFSNGLKIPTIRISFLSNAPPWIFMTIPKRLTSWWPFPPTRSPWMKATPRPWAILLAALYFLVDPVFLAKKYAQDIRSGQTGYAWVIDAQGTFLYHPEQDFIGKNAFEVREQKGARVSFDGDQ